MERPIDYFELSHALKKFTKSFNINIKSKDSPIKQLSDTRVNIRNILKKELEIMKGLKFVETLKVTFMKPIEGELMTFKSAFFNSKVSTIINENKITAVVSKSMEQISERIGIWIAEGSGWAIDAINSHYLNIITYKPLEGSSFIELPPELKNSAKGLINMKNNDDECFRWCHIRHLNPQCKDPGRFKKVDKEFIKKLDYSGVDFPVSKKQYLKIEKQNNISISLFGYSEKQVYPVYVSKENFEDHMDLLMISDSEKSHYVLISDFNKLMYNKTKYQHRKWFCKFCLQCFTKEKILEKHIEHCIIINGKQAVNMPDHNTYVKFKNHANKLKVPFVIYADFEAILEKTPIDTSELTGEKSYTKAYQKHVDCGYGYKVVCCYSDEYSKPVCVYRGPNAVYKFLGKMLEEVKYCMNIRKKFNKDLVMTKEEEKDFQNSTECHICNQPIMCNGSTKVRDHCYITGKYRGSAHQNCENIFRLTDKIPVIFHNLRGYDSHFIMQEIGKFKMDINVIPNNVEKYLSFMLGKNLVFIDSFQFMSSGLDRLVSNLPEESFRYTSEEFKNPMELKLMKSKGVYPYDYMSSFDKFNEQLPCKEEFYSVLDDSHISDEKYTHAKEVWKTFKLKNMGEYHDLYIKSDILLLADVFENFRKSCLQYYSLDPCHYFTSPGLAWDAMLKMTG